MPVERREQVIAVAIGSTGNGMSPICNGRRQPSCAGTSRMMREYQVRICERLRVQFPGPTRRKCLGGPGLQVGVVPGLAIFFEQRNRLLVSLKLHLVVSAIEILAHLGLQIVELFLMVSIERCRQADLDAW